jgi:hypothetical protein
MMATFKERRRAPRYKLNKDVLSINQQILAEVMDISRSGIACQCLMSTQKALPDFHEIELLNCELGTSIESLPCKMVRSDKKYILDAFTSTMIMSFSLEFKDLTEKQARELARFIQDNSLPADEQSLQ